MKVGIDIDGVIWDYERLMTEYARFYHKFILKKDSKEKIDEFFYLNRFDWTEEEKQEFMRIYSVYCTEKCPMINFAFEAINYLKLLDCKLICITARGGLSERTINVVKSRLEREKIFFDKTIWKAGNKVEACKNENIDIMIDDNPDNCTILSKNGIKCIYLNTSNSRHLEQNDNLIEMSSWVSVCEYFTDIMKKDVNVSKILKYE